MRAALLPDVASQSLFGVSMRKKKRLVEIQMENKFCKRYVAALRRNFEEMLKTPKYRKEMEAEIRKAVLGEK